VDLSTPDAFLTYALTVNGVGTIVSFLASFLIPRFWRGFADLLPDAKSNLMIALSFAVPLLAAVGLGNVSRNGLWLALVVGFQAGVASYGSNQVAYTRAYAAKAQVIRARRGSGDA
jgi:hypothetical protein